MQSRGFGRKGLEGAAPDGVAQPRGFGARPLDGMERQGDVVRAAPAPEDPYAAQRAAFIASERARRQEAGDPVEDHSSGYHQNAAVQAEVSRTRGSTPAPTTRKSMALAYVLWWFGYVLSAHRFYLGDTKGASIQCGGFLGGLTLLFIGSSASIDPLRPLGALLFIAAMVWAVIDLFLIPGLCRKANAGLDQPHRIFD